MQSLISTTQVIRLLLGYLNYFDKSWWAVQKIWVLFYFTEHLKAQNLNFLMTSCISSDSSLYHTYITLEYEVGRTYKITKACN